MTHHSLTKEGFKVDIFLAVTLHSKMFYGEKKSLKDNPNPKSFTIDFSCPENTGF